MKYPFESFPVWHHPFQSLKSNCETTNHILFKDMSKHFKPLTLTSLDSEPNGNYRSKTMEYIAQKYVFRARSMIISIDYQADAYEVDLDGGVRLLVRFMNEEDGQFDAGEESLYLVFLYLTKSYNKNVCPFKQVEQFLSYLHEQENRSTKKVFMKPRAIHEYPHFNTLPMIRRPRATTKRLINAYERKLNAFKTSKSDDDGFHYYEIPFCK